MSLLKNEIALIALGRIGSTLNVISIDTETSTHAKILRAWLPTSLQTLLEAHDWGFATKYAAPVLVEENPDGGWAYSYRMPDDCLVVRKIGSSYDELQDRNEYDDEIVRWEESYDDSGVPLMLTNVGDLKIKYTKNLSPDYAFPNHFGRALSAQLGMDIAPQLITNNFPKVKQAMLDTAKEDIAKGISYDINRKPPPPSSESIFIRARL